MRAKQSANASGEQSRSHFAHNGLAAVREYRTESLGDQAAFLYISPVVSAKSFRRVRTLR